MYLNNVRMVQYSKRFISLSIYLFCSIWPGNGIDLLFNRQRLCDLFLFSLNIHCSLCFVMILRCVWRKDLVSQIIVPNSLSKETWMIISFPKYKIFHKIIIICFLLGVQYIKLFILEYHTIYTRYWLYPGSSNLILRKLNEKILLIFFEKSIASKH